MLFGLHQLVETVVWWEQQDKVCHEAGGIAARIYLFIALVLVPIVVPVAFALLRTGLRPLLDRLYVACGVVSGTVGLVALADGPVGRAIEGHHVAYTVDQHSVGVVLFLYVVATCAPALSASSRAMVLFGIANLAAVAILAIMAQTAVISLWCFWAAITSVLINLELRRTALTTPPTLAEPAVRPTPAQKLEDDSPQPTS